MNKKYAAIFLSMILLVLSAAGSGCAAGEKTEEGTGNAVEVLEDIPEFSGAGAQSGPAPEDAGKCRHDIADEWQQKIDAALPGIVCWGDSITYGECSEDVKYPDELRRLIDEELIEPIRKKSGCESLTAPEVVNMGVDA